MEHINLEEPGAIAGVHMAGSRRGGVSGAQGSPVLSPVQPVYRGAIM